MALETHRTDEDDQVIVDAYKQIINNCVQEPIDIDKLATFDLEYIFIKLYAQSVNNVVSLSYRDNEDGKVYKFDVNLNEVDLVKDERHESVVKVTDQISIKLKYPTLGITNAMAAAETETQMFDIMLSNCIDTIYDEETVYEDYSSDELQEFLDSIDPTTFEKIRLFFSTMPCVKHVIKYTNETGTDRSIELKSLSDFFTY